MKSDLRFTMEWRELMELTNETDVLLAGKDVGRGMRGMSMRERIAFAVK